MFPSASASLDYDDRSLDVPMAKEVFKCLRNNMANCTDYTVHVGGTKFNCHKFVLSSCSGYFDALIKTDVSEKKSESSCTIEGIAPEIFGLILDVIYKGKHVLTEENMLELWHASSQLQMQFLVSACEKFVKENITLQNYWIIYQQAKLLDSCVIIKKVRKLMVNNFPRIVESKVFMQLSLDDIIHLLTKNSFERTSLVVNAVLKWTCSDDSYLTTEADTDSRGLGTSKADSDAVKEKSGKDDLRTTDGINPTLRRSYLGLLLALIPLKDATESCLIKLTNNKHVMENTGAITLVRQLGAKALGGRKSPGLSKRFKSNSYSENSSSSDEAKRIRKRRLRKYCKIHSHSSKSSESDEPYLMNDPYLMDDPQPTIFDRFLFALYVVLGVLAFIFAILVLQLLLY
ncbi:kelch-like protein 40 [Physella acuta]|uniref:kelch-like protein 40 n=1 Tax=Physella acuta TaxID=109671 RepID=UPI0027DDE259|nr:kelch-like protein 40 [Physella acuta]